MNVLITSVGRRTYLVDYFREAMDGRGQVHASNSHHTIALESADAHLISPLIYDDDYIPTILHYCSENEIRAIISLFDMDILVLSKNLELFSRNGIKIIAAPEESVRICNDKWQTSLFLSECAIKTPKTYLALADALAALSDGDISYPLVIKPRWGMASIGLYSVEIEEELRVLYERSKREVLCSHLKYESQSTPAAAVIIQEKLQGQEYGLDVINDLSGNYVRTFAKKKIAMRAGETDVGKTMSSVPFEEITRHISAKLNHEAVLSVDCFVNDAGIHVVEMNCRFSGHYPLSHLAGVNIPRQILEWLDGKPTNEDLLKFEEGLRITKDLVPRIIGSGKTGFHRRNRRRE